mgnify:CR=1 FL=1
MAYTINILPRARTEIHSNAEWMRRNYSPKAASKGYAGISAAIQALAHNPERYPEAEEASEFGVNLRVKLYGRRPHVFRILYRIRGDCVNVHRVRHAAQDWIADLDE